MFLETDRGVPGSAGRSRREEHDTAQMYGDSEKLLGQVHAASRFIIDTKHVGGGIPGESSKDKVIARAKQSLEDLQTDAVSYPHDFLPLGGAGNVFHGEEQVMLTRKG